MSTIFMSPHWFFGYSIIFELFFFLISAVIAGYALKVYRNTGQKLAQYFGYGFALMSLAYLVEAASNYFVYSGINARIASALGWVSTAPVDALGTWLYILLMICGLAVLLFVSLKSSKKRTLLLFLIVSVIAIIFSRNPMYVFFLLASIYLAFISWHFVEHYLKNRQRITLIVAIAFLFLWFGTFHFLISVNHQLFYVIGHILDFFAYIMILLNWYLVTK